MVETSFKSAARLGNLYNRSSFLTAIAFFVGLLAGGVQAAAITINSLADIAAADGQCTLREAIANANTDNQSGSADCAAGSGADIINMFECRCLSDNKVPKYAF